MQFERRKYPRHAAIEGNLFAVGTRNENFAAIRDLSTGGMQLQYISEFDRGDQWMQVTVIACNSHEPRMANVCCTPVYDIKSLMEDGTFSGVNVRLCGMCFCELTTHQKMDLQRLLNECRSCRLDAAK